MEMKPWRGDRWVKKFVSLKVKVKVAQSCLILCDPMDCSLPGSTFHGILQARILESVPFPSPEDLPNPRIKPRSPTLQVDSLLSKTPRKPEQREIHSIFLSYVNKDLIFLGHFSCHWIIAID